MLESIDNASLRINCAIAQLQTYSLLLSESESILSQSLIGEALSGIALILTDANSEILASLEGGSK